MNGGMNGGMNVFWAYSCKLTSQSLTARVANYRCVTIRLPSIYSLSQPRKPSCLSSGSDLINPAPCSKNT